MSGGSLEDIPRIRIEQAREILLDAESLYENRRNGISVVNRAYYAAFYALLAVLHTIGKTPKKHRGAISVFDVEFVVPGLVDRSMGSDLHWLFNRRLIVDYARFEPVDREEAGKALELARGFIKGAQDFLIKHGYVSEGELEGDGI